jgi:hypothetical protein
MGSTAVAILAEQLGVPEENTEELLDALDAAQFLPEDRRSELLEKLVTAEQFGGARRSYSPALPLPKLSEAVRLEHVSSARDPLRSAPYTEVAKSVALLRHGSFFKNVVTICKLAKVALTFGDGALVYLRPDEHTALSLGTSSPAVGQNKPVDEGRRKVPTA